MKQARYAQSLLHLRFPAGRGTAGLRLIVVLAALAALSAGCRSTPAAVGDPDAAFDSASALRASEQHSLAAKQFADFAVRYSYDSRADLAQFRSMQEYAAAGNSDAALRSYETLYANFPQSSHLTEANELCLKLGSNLLAENDEHGIKFLNAIINRAPYGPAGAAAHMELGRHYFDVGQFDAALPEFDKVATDQPNTAVALRAEFAAAVAEYHMVQHRIRNMDHVESARQRLLRLQKMPLQAQDMEAVDAYLRRLNDIAVENNLRLARSYLKQGELEPALAYLQEIVDKYPGSSYMKETADLIVYIRQESAKLRAAGQGQSSATEKTK